MNIKFRPFNNNSDAEYAAMGRIAIAIQPDSGWTMEGAKHWDSVRNPKHYWHRIVAENGDQIVGIGRFCETFWNEVEEEYSLYWQTDPACQRQGIAGAFYEYALDQMAADGRTIKMLTTDTLDDREDAMTMIKNRGFAQTQRYPRSELVLDGFDFAPYEGLRTKMVAEGIVIKTVTELMKTDPDHRRKLYELEWIFEQDEPTPDIPVKRPFEEWEKDYFDDPSFHPDGFFVATDGDTYAGWSAVIPNKNDPSFMYQGWTGTDRPYRRKGVATFLKLSTIEHAQQRGAARIRTDNEETNPMYQINVKLGFKPIPAYVTYKKKVAE